MPVALNCEVHSIYERKIEGKISSTILFKQSLAECLLQSRIKGLDMVRKKILKILGRYIIFHFVQENEFVFAAAC